MKQKLYLRLKYGNGNGKVDYKLFQLDNKYILYKNRSISKKGELKELKDFLKKRYKIWFKRLQKRIAHLVGDPYINRYKIPNIIRYL